MNRSRITVSRGLWTTLLLLAVALTSCIFIAAGIWFALPREPVVSAGYMDEYSWEQPEYIPIQNGIGIFLDSSGDQVVTLDATSTTSSCRILWHQVRTVTSIHVVAGNGRGMALHSCVLRKLIGLCPDL